MCAKLFATAPSVDPVAEPVPAEVVVGRMFPVRVALNVNVSDVASPATILPPTVKFVPIVKSAANLDVMVAYNPPVVRIDAYVPSVCAPTAETTESAESAVPV